MQKNKLINLLLIIIVIGLLTGCFLREDEGVLSLHFIDVGQGDSILIKTPNDKTLLIDGGEPSAGKNVTSYLRKNKVKKIDILIATHPHADHIGGLVDVVNNFPIDKFYMPKKAHTSKTYEKLLQTVKDNNLKVTAATNDIVVELDEDIILYFLGPMKDYGDNLNMWSVILKMDYKDKSFLFTGDLEYLGEKDLIQEYPRSFLQAQVLKVGHHGSNTSTCGEFLEVVNPKVAVISAGSNNPYGHPHQEVLEGLTKFPVAIYRTDKQGTIVIKSDGHRIWSHLEPYFY
ncbi:ComEC/Rec2 family competence protein [Natronincola ferrireducens]|uniref:ComEC/Rec2 family competence protein n=1 Tax=Natronincola ferrireducens TaxID=393762 RepID=UPI00159FE455|nr:ComEC/Rec2 family competence protein [Natronincola ferrireducens]